MFLRTRPHGRGPASELLTSRVCWVDARQVDLHITPGDGLAAFTETSRSLARAFRAESTRSLFFSDAGASTSGATSLQKAGASGGPGAAEAWSHVLAEACSNVDAQVQ